MNMNTGLRVVVAALLGTTMQMTFAASPTDPIKFPSEIGTPAGEINVTGGAVAFDIPIMGGKLIKTKTATSDEPYFVNITLSGGAVFGELPVSLACTYSGAVVANATVDSPPVTVRGNVATYRLAPGNSAGSVAGSLTGTTCTLNLSAANAIILTSGVKDYGITVTAAWFDAYEKVSASVVGTLITFAQGAQASVEQGQVTVDVSSPSLSKNFITLANNVSATVAAGGTIVARLGSIKYAQTVGVKTLGMVQTDTNDYLKSFTLTVSGAPLNAVQQTATTSAHSSAGIFLSLDACVDSAAIPAGSPRNPTSGKITFVGVVPAPANAATVTWSVCMVANGVNAIERGQVGFTIGPIVGVVTSDVPNLSVVDPTLTTVAKNGTSLKVLNIPSPDSPYDLPTIRFYNMGTTTGRITGTLYGQGDANNVGGGEVLGASNTILVESLAPNAVKAIPSAEIGKLFGKTTWTGRAWLQIESEIKGLRVQALIRTNVGGQLVLTNMSDRVMLDGETLERTE